MLLSKHLALPGILSSYTGVLNNLCSGAFHFSFYYTLGLGFTKNTPQPRNGVGIALSKSRKKIILNFHKWVACFGGAGCKFGSAVFLPLAIITTMRCLALRYNRVCYEGHEGHERKLPKGFQA
jgi:hypothetical protein